MSGAFVGVGVGVGNAPRRPGVIEIGWNGSGVDVFVGVAVAVGVGVRGGSKTVKERTNSGIGGAQRAAYPSEVNRVGSIVRLPASDVKENRSSPDTRETIARFRSFALPNETSYGVSVSSLAPLIETTCVSRDVTRVVPPAVDTPWPGTNAIEEIVGTPVRSDAGKTSWPAT